MEIPGPTVEDYLPFLEFFLSDNRFGDMFLKFSDSAAYGNNLLHVCVELHNIDFTPIIVAKDAEYGANLMTQRNGNGLTPGELLQKEFEKVDNGVNPEKKARQRAFLMNLRELLPQQQPPQQESEQQ